MMRKFSSTLFLALFLSITALGGDMPGGGYSGNTPISDYEGCAPGVYWVPAGVCCMPGQECPFGNGLGGRAAQATVKTEDIFGSASDSFFNLIFGLP
jgi:hypothetical protein